METLVIKNLTFSYPEQSQKALDDFSLSVEGGEFLVLCGSSGCGKSTLLRQLKTVLQPHGRKSGTVLFEGMPLEQIGDREQSRKIGFVMQNPETQIVTDKVWHELAFGLESLGYDTPTIRRRVAEMTSFFGIQGWFYKNVTELSGGQKQLLNLAAVMVMQPSLLILDEPTAQLDPIAAGDFLSILGKINRELGTTIVLTEHRLEEAFPLSTRVVVMDGGKLLCSGAPEDVGHMLRDKGHGMFLAMPTAMRIWAAVHSYDACPVNVPTAVGTASFEKPQSDTSAIETAAIYEKESSFNRGDDAGNVSEEKKKSFRKCSTKCPVTVSQGRNWLENFAAEKSLLPIPAENIRECSQESAIKGEDLWFKYEKDMPDVVKGLNIDVKKGEFVALLGGNGTGKTSSVKVLSGLEKTYRGQVKLDGKIAVLPQNPQTLFVKKTVREDLHELMKEQRQSSEESQRRLGNVVALCRLEELLERHPYDLSGGEQQRAALAKVLLLEPDILFMDEPTKGLDAEFKQVFAEIMQALLSRGKTILMVSHDVEFCAEYAHRCALFFDGSIVAEGRPRSFFSGNSFYTTAANRIARSLLPEAVTVEDVVTACGGGMQDVEHTTTSEPASISTLPVSPTTATTASSVAAATTATTASSVAAPTAVDAVPSEPEPPKGAEVKASKSLPVWRKVIAALSALVAGAAFLKVSKMTNLGMVEDADDIIEMVGPQTYLYVILLVALFVFALSVSQKTKRPDYMLQTPKEKRNLTKRTLAATAIILTLMPATIFVGMYYFADKKYYFISLMLLIETMMPFFMVFEDRKPKARELVTIAVLCAIGVAGRAAFFMLPSFKPVMALTIIAGVAFGGETGFMVGAMTMLISNIMFSQGPWTPWQMFAMGIIGFLAGVLFRKGWLLRSRNALTVFGALSAIVIYGGIMNPGSALMWVQDVNWEIIIAYYITGFPVDCVHAAATAFFLWVAAEPMLEKLDRIKVKYGLVE